MGSRLCVIALGLLGTFAVATARAETFEFDAPMYEGPGKTLVDSQHPAGNFLADKPTKHVRISGTLTFPQGVTGPVPAVLVTHTSGGPGPDGRLAETNLNKFGYATVNYDSYKPRGFFNNNQQGSNPAKLETNQVVDAYLALKKLSTDPRIDAKRIAIVGMSAGGNTAFLAGVNWIRERYVGADGPRFAALLAMYPGGFVLPAAADMAGSAPILVLPAEKDDFMAWTRTKVWVDYVKRENPSTPIETIVVPGAHHSFMNNNTRGFNNDTPAVISCPFLLAIKDSQTPALLQMDGSVSGAPMERSCAKRGSTTQYSGEAATFALNATLEFLKKTFDAAK